MPYFLSPLQYDTGIEILTSFCKIYATRLSEHIHEWCRRRSIYKALEFEDRVYMDWFLISLLVPIGKDVASHFTQFEEVALQVALKYEHLVSSLNKRTLNHKSSWYIVVGKLKDNWPHCVGHSIKKSFI